MVGATLSIRATWCLPHSLLHASTTPAQVPHPFPHPKQPKLVGEGCWPRGPAAVASKGQVDGTFPAKSPQDEAG